MAVNFINGSLEGFPFYPSFNDKPEERSYLIINWG